ncbi:MAG: lipoyl synthase [Bacteroidales bacterium]|nr:lipoyl synthase [Bacteroidales bacterium]
MKGGNSRCDLKDRKRLPSWMRMQMPGGDRYMQVKEQVVRHGLHTICTSGNCPNIGECWAAGTATFMILGDICTRSCKFCAVKTGKPLPVDEEEPLRLARTIRTMGIRHAVLTSVDRDDLEDKGAGFWARTIQILKEEVPGLTMETLIPDFDALPGLVQLVIDAAPEVISHNLETVERLTPRVRSRARYQRSLQVISQIAQSALISKSGIMLGLGETEQEILQTMDDLIGSGCEVLTLGQYLQPTLAHMPVDEYIHPDKFEYYRKQAHAKGFRAVESSPLVRSSYHAGKHASIKKGRTNG